MPTIRQYDAPQGLGLQPDERGVDAALQVARRGGAFFNQASQAAETVGRMEGRMAETALRDVGNVAVDFAQHQEISHGAAAYANLNAKLTDAWNETAKAADPNDPTVAQQFRENVLEPALQKYQEGFLTEGGQKFAEARIDSLRNHMFEKTSADMGALAARAVSVNVNQTANSLSNTAMTDPSSVPHLLESADGLVGDMVSSSPNLRGSAAAGARIELTEKMKENIVKSGAIGAIQKAADPEAEAKNGERVTHNTSAVRTSRRLRRMPALKSMPGMLTLPINACCKTRRPKNARTRPRRQCCRSSTAAIQSSSPKFLRRPSSTIRT